jgi:pilus assembly protein Flp/PilA
MGAAPRRSGEPPRGEAGQGLAEYALILALIAIVAVVALAFLGGNLQSTLSMIGNSVHIQ